ncbi:polysaccharide biosynthesis/export family protein [Ascidiimonas aurantiaca]|uniref:polysaccharide biosynthesis/export family protein n=1 Tax=Ascidiimonas aurantiaca TaxID=1685432 RepID=UPI0030ECE3C6
MKKLTPFFVKRLLSLSLIAVFTVSCATRKEVVYFQNAKDFETIVDTDTFTTKLKVNDILTISLSTFDQEATGPFNLYKTSDFGRSAPVDYLIDKDGMIDYPVLGKIKLGGLSIQQAKDLLKEKLADYLKDPIINIRLLNFRVTVLGSVNRPGTYNISGERITILEALGQAGDLTIKGRRDNVLVIRDFKGTKVYTRIDLTNKESLNSPVYFLTQNDIVYVEPNRSAIVSSTLDNRTSIAISIITTLITAGVLLLTR